MNKHMRLVVSALFIVIILLAVAITRFYSSTGKSTGGGGVQPVVERKLATDSSGNRIFEDSSGLYGIADSSDRIIVLPEWQELSFTDSELCVAAKQIKGKKLYGCIDYEGNIAVPFIYSDISHHNVNGFSFYTAQANADSSCVIYDERFLPCFSRAWSGFAINGKDVIFNTEKGAYTYSVNNSGFSIKNATVEGDVLDRGYEIKINSRILLTKLSVSMLEDIALGTERYIEYAFTEDAGLISEIRNSGVFNFSALFSADEKIRERNLLGISDIFVYSVRSDDGRSHYMVQIAVDAEIVYEDENGNAGTLRDEYRANLEFSEESAGELSAYSGRFLRSEPDYPEPDIEPIADENIPENASENNMPNIE